MIARLAALVATVALVPGATASATTPTHENGRIALTYNSALILMSPDGTGAWPASHGDTQSADSWSPDGTRLLVGNAHDVYAVDPDGGNRTQLTFWPGWDGDAAYSPDGSRIAFESDRGGGQTGIWVMNADGSDAHRITKSFAYAVTPTWSPDGGRIAFASDDGIWVTTADGVGAGHIVGLNAGKAINPAWSPDGTMIAFALSAGNDYDIYTVRLPDGDLNRLTDHPADDTHPVWSPDGTQILFGRSRANETDLYLMNADGTHQRQITTGGITEGRAAWQPLGPPPAAYCTIWGTAANDLLVGSSVADGICGLGGDDHIFGQEGRDRIDAGAGNDTIVPGPGFDLTDAGPGDDLVDSRDNERDAVGGNAGTDTVLADRSDLRLEVEHTTFPDPGNLARGRPVRASQTLPNGPAEFAVDGHRVLWWAALYAPQWIEIDLGHPYSVGRVALLAAQTPPGETDHLILGRGSPIARWRGLAELKGVTHDRQVLTATARRPWRNVRYIRIETRASPSWVAWKEIAVYR